MQKTIQLDPQIAQQFGANASILFSNIHFWLTENLKKKKNFFDKRVWMYCSIRQLKEQYSYLTTRQIRHALEKLSEAGILLKNNFNKTRYDRTIWYSINSDEFLAKNAQTLRFSHLAQTTNGNGDFAKPIPDIKHIPNQPTNLLLTTEQTNQKLEDSKVEKITKLTLGDLIDRLKTNLKRSCVPMEYIKERASYFYERYKHIHVSSIAKLICSDWKQSHPKKPKIAVKNRKIQSIQFSYSKDKKPVKIDTSAWLEGIINQVKMDQNEQVIAQAKLDEYLGFGNRPSFLGALQYVERGLELSRKTKQRTQLISDTLDQNAKNKAKQWASRAYKTTLEKITDTSWVGEHWLDQFETA